MAEISRFWNGTSIGDAASEAPYDAPTEFAAVLRSIAGAAAVATNLGGVFRGELNELEVSGTSSPVAVASGRALAYGNWYENSASVNVAIPTPVTLTRIDRIVLRKDWSAQTVRITRIAGVEGGGVPAMTQNAGTTWDTPLASASITTGGVITLTDDRQFFGSGSAGSTIVKLADEILNNDSALQADDELFFAVEANAVYEFDLWIRFMSATAADFKFEIDTPVTTDLTTFTYGQIPTGGAFAVNEYTGGSQSATGQGVATLSFMRIQGTVSTGAAAGTVGLLWAQNSADPTDTTVVANSTLTYRKLSN